MRPWTLILILVLSAQVIVLGALQLTQSTDVALLLPGLQPARVQRLELTRGAILRREKAIIGDLAAARAALDGATDEAERARLTERLAALEREQAALPFERTVVLLRTGEEWRIEGFPDLPLRLDASTDRSRYAAELHRHPVEPDSLTPLGKALYELFPSETTSRQSQIDRRLLRTLANLEVSRPVTTDPGRFGLYGVADDDFELHIVCRDGEGGVLADCFVKPVDRTGTVWVRRAGEDRVFEAVVESPASTFNGRIDSLIVRDLLHLEPQDVTRIVLRPPGAEPIILVREAGPGWRALAGLDGTPDLVRVNDLLGNACTLAMAAPDSSTVRPHHGLDPGYLLELHGQRVRDITPRSPAGIPLLVPILEEERQLAVIRIGGRASIDGGAGFHYAQLDGNPMVVRIPLYAAESMCPDAAELLRGAPAEDPGTQEDPGFIGPTLPGGDGE